MSTRTVQTVFVIGLGSMGKRRVRNLVRLGVTRIVGFDPRADRRDEAKAQSPRLEVVLDASAGFEAPPDAVVISTPPELHVGYAREAVRRGLPFFMEASVLDHNMKVLASEAAAAGVVAAPSCTLRFQPSVKRMKALVDEGRVGQIFAYTHHSGQYLPDWHPWEDYRRFYAGQRMTGACREIVPFEFAWLTWLAGRVNAVTAMKGRVGDLDVDIDDVYQVLVRHENGALGHLLVDVLSRTAIRRCTIVGSKGVLEWDWSKKRVTLFEAQTRDPIVFEEQSGAVYAGYVHAEAPYVEEMETYLAAVRGERQWPYTLRDDLDGLRLLQAAESSSMAQAAFPDV